MKVEKSALEDEVEELRLAVARLEGRVAALEGVKGVDLYAGCMVRIVRGKKYVGRRARVLGRRGGSACYWDLEVVKLVHEKRAPRVYRGRSSLEIIE